MLLEDEIKIKYKVLEMKLSIRQKKKDDNRAAADTLAGRGVLMTSSLITLI